MRVSKLCEKKKNIMGHCMKTESEKSFSTVKLNLLISKQHAHNDTKSSEWNFRGLSSNEESHKKTSD